MAILIKNGKIYTMAGSVIDNGSILIQDGKIAAIGAEVEAPTAAQIIDAGGRMIVPGMIDAHSHLGMAESAIGFEGSDSNESTAPNTAQMRAIDGINPMDVTFQEAREAGVTLVATGPGSANVIGGTFAAIKTYGICVDDMVVKEPVAMKCAFGENPKRVYGNQRKTPSTRMGTAAVIRSALYKAKQYMEAKERAQDDPSKAPQFDLQKEA